MGKTLREDERELWRIYKSADTELQELIYRMLVLAVKYGRDFLLETDSPANAGDRDALRATIEKWEAKSGEQRGAV